MRNTIVIAWLAAMAAGCGAANNEECPCPSGLVCCSGGSGRCAVENTPEACGSPMATPDLAVERAPDLAVKPNADLATADFARPSERDMAITVDFQPQLVTLGDVLMGKSATATIQILNPGLAYIYSVTLTDSQVGQLFVEDGCRGTSTASCTVVVTFNAQQPGPVSASLAVNTTAGTFSGCPISGRTMPGTPQLTVDRQSLEFGDQHVGTTSAALSLLVTNGGNGSSGFLTAGLAATGPFKLDSASHFDACGPALSVGATCHLYVLFAPTQEGPASGSLSIGDGSVSSPAITLGGKGIDPAALQVSAGSFPNVWMPGTADVTFHVSNGGGDPTGTLGATIGGNDVADFSIVSDGCTGQALAGHGSCDVAVRFTANSRGQRQALLVVGDGGSNSANQLLLADALQPGTISVYAGTGSLTSPNPVNVISYILKDSGDGSFGPLSATVDGTSGGVFSVLSSSSCLSQVVTAGQTCELDLQMVAPYQGHYTDGVTVTSPGMPASVTPAPLHLPLDGTFAAPDTLRLSPSPLKMGTVNNAGWDTVTVWNTTAQPVGPLSDSLSGDSNFSFFDDSNCAGQTLAAGGRCKIKVEYTPTYSGTFTATLAITAPTASASVAISASSSLPGLSFSPAKVDFGTVAITNVPPITVTITNVSNAPQSTSYVVSSSSFWVVNSCPATLLPTVGSNSCTISVGFSPTQAATYNGTISFSQAHAPAILSLTAKAQ